MSSFDSWDGVVFLPYISELKQGTNRSLVSFTSLVISSDNVNRGLVLLQSTPLIKDTLVPAPLSFIEGVSSTEGFWSSSSYMLLYYHLGTSEAELILSEGTRLCICWLHNVFAAIHNIKHHSLSWCMIMQWLFKVCTCGSWSIASRLEEMIKCTTWRKLEE